MRSATLPPIRVEEAFRASVESVLREGETLTAFIEAEVRRAVEHRLMDREFLKRAQVSWEDYKRTGVSYTTEQMDERLRGLVEQHRQRIEQQCGNSES